MALADRDRRDRHDQRKAGGGEDREGGSIPKVEYAAVQEERRRAAHNQEEGEEERQLEQAYRVVRERRQVEVDTAHDEEEGDQEAVADRCELRLEHFHLASLQREASNHSGNEAAQQQVEAERCSKRAEREHHDHGDADRQLAARLETAVEQPPSRVPRRGRRGSLPPPPPR